MPTMTDEDATQVFRRAPERFLDMGPNGGEVAYRRVGHGPDVLFVHGWPVSAATFRRLLPHLAERVTCHLIDLPGTGSSRFSGATELSIDGHIRAVRRTLDVLELDRVAVVGHDSGGMIARHALAGDPRLIALGLINTEQLRGPTWRFKLFLAARHAPGLAPTLGWAAGHRRVRRNRLVFGAAFADRALLDGEFDELFLSPLHREPARRDAAARLLRSVGSHHLRDLGELHRRITVPVQLVWGDQDPFFPLRWAEEMVPSFPDARLHVVRGAGLFCHEERPAEVAEALLPTLLGLGRPDTAADQRP